MTMFDLLALALAALIFGLFALELISALRRWRHHDHLISGHPRTPRKTG